MRAMLSTLVTIIFLLYPNSKIPADAWQNGTLVHSEESWHSRAVQSNQREYPIVRYTVDTSEYTYDADLVLRRATDKQPAVTVNGPIKFTIIKSDFYIQDEQGKAWKLVLARKTAKTAAR